MKPSRLTLAVLFGALSLALAAPVAAQEKASREKQALQRAQQALREAQSERDELQSKQSALTAEKTSLEADKARLSGEVKKLGAAQAQARAAQGKAAELEAANAKLQEQLAQAQAQATELNAKLADAQGRLRTVSSLLASSTQNQTVLEQRNAQLYQVGLAAIELYRAKNPADAWLQKASVLGLSEVRVENAAEEMRTKLDDARYFAPAPALAATAAGPR